MSLATLWINPTTRVVLGALDGNPRRLRMAKPSPKSFTVVDFRQLVMAADEVGLDSLAPVALSRHHITVNTARPDEQPWTLSYLRAFVAEADRDEVDGAEVVQVHFRTGIRILKGAN